MTWRCFIALFATVNIFGKTLVATIHQDSKSVQDDRLAALEASLEIIQAKLEKQELSWQFRYNKLETELWMKIKALETDARQKKVIGHNMLLPNETAFMPKSNPVGAFSAYLNTTTHYNQYQTVVFPYTVYNSGDYSPVTGVFTAPLTGVYAFHVNIIGCGGSSHMSVRLRRDTEVLAYIGVGNDATGDNLFTRSSTIVAHVEFLQQVAVDVYSYYPENSGCLYTEPQYGYNYFTAYPIEQTI